MLSTALLLCAVSAGVPLFKGERPAVSPDGRRIAFECVRNGSIDLAIFDLLAKESSFVTKDSGIACFPAWKDAETLVYSSFPKALTAYEAAACHSVDGFNLHSSSRGAVSRLTFGRWFDTGSAWVPGTETCFYVSSEGEVGARNRLIRVRDGKWAERDVVVVPGGRNCGLASPAVSPDGKLLAWAQLDDPFGVWHLCVAEVEAPQDYSLILPEGDVGFAPSFHPDSRHVFYTGYRKGDPTWGIWVVDCVSGGAIRLFDGMRPCVTPDGKSVVYERHGKIFCADIGEVELPMGELLRPEGDLSSEMEVVLLEMDFPKSPLKLPDSDFGVNDTVFCEVEFCYDGNKSGLAPLFRCFYNGQPLAFQAYLDKGMPWLATRNKSGERFVGLNSGRRIELGSHKLAAVRGSDGRLILSVDDEPLQISSIARKEDLIRLDNPADLVLGSSPVVIRSVRFGKGWPRGMNRLHVRKGIIQ